jgi:hypothetical protein
MEAKIKWDLSSLAGGEWIKLEIVVITACIIEVLLNFLFGTNVIATVITFVMLTIILLIITVLPEYIVSKRKIKKERIER